MTEVLVLKEKENEKTLVVGHHYYGELYGCNPNILSDEEKLKNIVVEAAKIGGFHLLDVKAWKINPGVSVIGIVLESHISIHTWPEYEFATVDVYTCGSKGDPYKAFLYIADKLEAKRYIVRYSNRNFRE
ncbi:adenosylmethionine decarboxylase [Desulfurococcaceae archaeon MEX13E-LK6-19]|nr:adenosylmethionine decarboxylase [Desulfurococcaceae archaeon MEX13E-LK6-19]